MNQLEQAYIAAYENYMGALDDVRMIKETLRETSMAYFESLKKDRS